MSNLLTDTDIFQKAEDAAGEAYNATKDFLFGDAGADEGYVGPSDSRLFNTILGHRVRIGIDENIPSGYVGVTRAVPLEYPIGLTSPKTTGTGPYVTFYAFDYEKTSPARRDPKTVSQKAFDVDTIAPGVTPLFSVSLPFRGNIKKGSVADVGEVDTIVSRAVSGAGQKEGAENTQSAFEQVAAGFAAGGAKAIIGNLFNSAAAQDIKDQTALTTGYAFNPAVEMLYKRPGINSHSFEFTFVPVSAQEAKIVNRILNAFQEYSLPVEAAQLREGANGLLMEFPALYEIRFYRPNGEPMFDVADIPDCTITNISVVYDPTGTGRLTSDGRPISYRLTIEFTEMKIMTRNDWRMLRGLSAVKQPYEEVGINPQESALGRESLLSPIAGLADRAVGSAIDYAKGKVGDLWS